MSVGGVHSLLAHQANTRRLPGIDNAQCQKDIFGLILRAELRLHRTPWICLVRFFKRTACSYDLPLLPPSWPDVAMLKALITSVVFAQLGLALNGVVFAAYKDARCTESANNGVRGARLMLDGTCGSVTRDGPSTAFIVYRYDEQKACQGKFSSNKSFVRN